MFTLIQSQRKDGCRKSSQERTFERTRNIIAQTKHFFQCKSHSWSCNRWILLLDMFGFFCRENPKFRNTRNHGALARFKMRHVLAIDASVIPLAVSSIDRAKDSHRKSAVKLHMRTNIVDISISLSSIPLMNATSSSYPGKRRHCNIGLLKIYRLLILTKVQFPMNRWNWRFGIRQKNIPDHSAV